MRQLRITEDSDGQTWIEELDGGEWTRVDTSPDRAPFRVGEIRGLNASKIDGIAEAFEHPQRHVAEEIRGFARSISEASPKSPLDSLKSAFRQPVTPSEPAEGGRIAPDFTAMKRPPSIYEAVAQAALPDPGPNLLHEVIAQLEEQNKHLGRQNVILAEQRDNAQEHAEATEKDAKGSRTLAWVAIGVTVAVGLAQIVLSIIELNS